MKPQTNWYRGNVGFFTPALSSDSIPVPYWVHVGHSEVVFQTNPSFQGQVTLSAVPTNTNQDASAISVFVDGVYNQTILFDVNTLLNHQQTASINVGAVGSHTITIQEGERDPGVFLTDVTLDGSPVILPSILRSYSTMGDSVSMGVFGVPRSVGWAQKMKRGSRFDSVTNLGQSGYALSTMINGGAVGFWVSALIPSTAAYVGNVENVVALCLGLNDWLTSASSTTAATYQTNLTTLVDAIKVAADAQKIPGFKVMLHSLTWILSSAQLPNDKGSTPAQFNAAVQAVATARSSFCTFLNVFNACTDADMADVDHPNNVGHGKIYNVVVGAT